MSDQAVVKNLPLCDFDPRHGHARFDFRTKYGSWANGCEECWRTNRASSTLGTGHGQRLVVKARRGWWDMACWNGLSTEQQTRLVLVGNLPIDYQPEGECQAGATCAIETEHDTAPGPRFYCTACAIAYLNERETGT
jgi:hypothetical protein